MASGIRMVRRSFKCIELSFEYSGMLWLSILVLCSMIVIVQCENFRDYDGISNSSISVITQLAYRRLTNMTFAVNQQLVEKSNFCVNDPDDDWNRAFNFSYNLEFLSSCIEETRGDFAGRLCTAAEIKFYFDSLLEKTGNGNNANYLKPNRNCNLTNWVDGCEPGWACSTDELKVRLDFDFRNSQVIPERTSNCQACCEGFFCPHGITCMIQYCALTPLFLLASECDLEACPLGSYCPSAILNSMTGVCEPYLYQLPPGKPNHTCGGANTWAAASMNNDIFCPSGSYCPTTTEKISCGEGSYCRMGSTVEHKCYRLNSCDTNTSKQNIHLYGAMLIVAVSGLLLFIYNCSDQVLTIRERRFAKSRERAARIARETAQARQRWRAARQAATKQSRELQAQFSRTFECKSYSETDNDQASPLRHNASTPVVPSSSSLMVMGNRKDTVELVRMIREIEDGHCITDENNVLSEVKSPTKDAEIPKKKLQSHSQIFRYAYSELEKENAQQHDNKGLTFSAAIKMTTDTHERKRPLMEIAFKDLTLSLQAKKKNLLRCVTGTIKPGRITAVMGPSGAGKTTLLSAIAGKVCGCRMTGSILINGKTDSIQSYKKIIGFVPQDDIVHGNLTVEENLWFSAKCRLSAGLLKPDKVLIVERVIRSLGLQAVRDSLVGTVEKRGISGGQRKRVNVGIEMVMEPSLLILDEPTSGLDSASSQLLLRALRREALEGVNICLVVHQPSYGLFNMFDDLILLAKGGLVVYHGSVNKVEEYFAGIGIDIPERVNPPDYFIDILEGIVVPGGGLSSKDLPVRWMLSKGYPVPPDMHNDVDSISSAGIYHHNMMIRNESDIFQTFAGELWQDVVTNLETQKDKLRFNFLKSKDLSHRRTPGIIMQYWFFLSRVIKQRLREAKTEAVDYLILLLAGASLGSLAKMRDGNMGAAAYTYTVIAVSLLCKIAALRTFSQDKLQFWRERNSGMSSLAYFLSKDTLDHFNTVIKPVVYLSMFYFFTNPRSTFTENYTVLLCLVYCVTGIGYAFAILFEPGAAQLWSVLIPVVLTLISTQTNHNKLLRYITVVCYPKWALEAFVIVNAKRYYGVWLITRCAVLAENGYNVHDWTLCISVLILIGVVSRAVAFSSILIFHKK